MLNRETAILILQRGNQTGRTYPLDQAELVIGRSPDCEIVLDDRQVSRRHARIFRRGDRFFVEDLGSKNSTHLNGRELLSVAPLDDGDEIQIALRFKLAFVDAEQTAPLLFPSAPPDVRVEALFGDLVQAKPAAEPVEPRPVRLSLLRIEPDTRQVLLGERALAPPLSLPQYRLLELLMQTAGGIVSRDEIIRTIWPDDAEEGISEQAIDALVRRLRERLAELDPAHAFILTMRGHGFRFQNRDA